ncbi:hypothetical protein ACP70R_026799 [Stipagrostis hirtigluma subsp. patula]
MSTAQRLPHTAAPRRKPQTKHALHNASLGLSLSLPQPSLHIRPAGNLQAQPADASPMATRGRPSQLVRALTLTAAILLLLTSSLPLSNAATVISLSPSPSPSTAPAPAPSPRQQAASTTKNPRATPPPPPRYLGPRDGPRAPAPPSSGWTRHGLNFGERLGVALAGVAVAMQVAFAAFLAVRAWQLRRRRRAGKAEASAPVTVGV